MVKCQTMNIHEEVKSCSGCKIGILECVENEQAEPFVGWKGKVCLVCLLECYIPEQGVLGVQCKALVIRT